MKRGSFLKFGVAIGAFLMTPFGTIAKSGPRIRDDKGFKVDAGKDRFNKSISPFEGDNFYTKVTPGFSKILSVVIDKITNAVNPAITAPILFNVSFFIFLKSIINYLNFQGTL